MSSNKGLTEDLLDKVDQELESAGKEIISGIMQKGKEGIAQMISSKAQNLSAEPEWIKTAKAYENVVGKKMFKMPEDFKSQKTASKTKTKSTDMER